MLAPMTSAIASASVAVRAWSRMRNPAVAAIASSRLSQHGERRRAAGAAPSSTRICAEPSSSAPPPRIASVDGTARLHRFQDAQRQ